MRRHLAVWAQLSLVLALALPGCGTDDEERSEVATAQLTAHHHLDPAYAYRRDGLRPLEASETMSLAYVPLLAYRREEAPAGAELIPGLAGDLPEISDDGRTYVLTLREELEYSNRAPVRARDFEHAVKRVLIADGPAASFLDGVEGAAEYRDAGDPDGGIAGIRADDESGEIVIRLVEPDASFSHALAMWPAAPVPRTTPFRDRSDDPPAGVGPYVIGQAEPGEGFELVRSHTFPQLAIPDIPTGNIDRIVVEAIDDPAEGAAAVLEGRLDYAAGPPTGETRSRLLANGDERYSEEPGPGTLFFYFDPAAAPFDDPRVREAVNHAIDRAELARLAGPGLAPGCSLLAPGVPGYGEDLDGIRCPYGEPARPPDPERARRLVEAAGATGAEVALWQSDEDWANRVLEHYAETLGEIGLEVRWAEADAQPATTAGPMTAPAGSTGLAAWVADFPHPLNLYSAFGAEDPGRDLPDLDDRTLEREVEQLNLEPDLRAVEEDWEELDRYVVSPPQSYVAPFAHVVTTRLLSDRLDLDLARSHPVYLNDHLSFALAEAP